MPSTRLERLPFHVKGCMAKHAWAARVSLDGNMIDLDMAKGLETCATSLSAEHVSLESLARSSLPFCFIRN